MIRGERHVSMGLQNAVTVSIIHKTTVSYKPLSCMRTWSVYNCKESTDPAPMNSLSPHLPPIFGEFLYFHLLIGFFILAYINVNTEKNFYSHTPPPPHPQQALFLWGLVVLPLLLKHLSVSRLASWKTVCGYKRAKPGLSTWIWGGLLRILGHFASVQNYFKA